MEFDATLRIIKTRRGFEHKAEFTNQKGKVVAFAVLETARHYEGAADGDACRIWLDGPTIVKCVIPGKEATPKTTNNKKSAAAVPDYRQNRGYFQGGAPKNVSRTPFYGWAPYNFVPYDPGVLAPPKKDEARKWSGSIICELEALTPLLVSGEQKKGGDVAAECAFAQINGRKIIPGTAVKGMLRSLMEILSFSGLRPVSGKKLFWREVSAGNYRVYFPADPLGGFLLKRGADYFLRPVKVTPVPFSKGDPPGKERVQTGGFFVKGKRSKDYLFALPGKNAEEIEVDREVVARFRAQLTENQEGRWPEKERGARMAKDPGLPVFYRQADDGEIIELGFCRYFRLEYKYSPRQLAWPNRGEEEREDIARSIFGSVGKTSRAGRVAIEPFEIRGEEYAPNGVEVVLGSPKPTCLGFYLNQNPASIRIISDGQKNEDLTSYNNKDARLRGRKLYWHHKADPQYFPVGNGNKNTLSRLRPLAPGAKGEFVIHVNRLTDSELGCLLEALELREGCAHKLGMGRSLGFGSARLRVKAANIADVRQKYQSLAARLQNPVPRPLSREEMDNFREVFRAHIFASVKAKWPQAKDFYALPQIADLFLMLDYARKPEPSRVRTMTLKEFGRNPILPSPKSVLEGKR